MCSIIGYNSEQYFKELYSINYHFPNWRNDLCHIVIYNVVSNNAVKVNIVLHDNTLNYDYNKHKWLNEVHYNCLFYINIKYEYERSLYNPGFVVYPYQFTPQELENFDFVYNKIKTILLLKS